MKMQKKLFAFPWLLVNKVLAEDDFIPSWLNGSQPRGSPSVTLDNPLGTANIMVIINNILNYLIYISVPILAIMILIGGFQILMARDNPEKIQKGRTTLMYSVIGFTIILISKGVALILLRILKP